MIAFVDTYRATFGVEPICKTLPIAPSTYYAAKAVERAPDRASPRSTRDAALKEVMGKLWKDNRSVYGYKKLWHALRREGHDVARCTVARLMREMGLRGAPCAVSFGARKSSPPTPIRPSPARMIG